MFCKVHNFLLFIPVWGIGITSVLFFLVGLGEGVSGEREGN